MFSLDQQPYKNPKHLNIFRHSLVHVNEDETREKDEDTYQLSIWWRMFQIRHDKCHSRRGP